MSGERLPSQFVFLTALSMWPKGMFIERDEVNGQGPAGFAAPGGSFTNDRGSVPSPGGRTARLRRQTTLSWRRERIAAGFRNHNRSSCP